MNLEFEANVERDVDFSTRTTRNMKRPMMINRSMDLYACATCLFLFVLFFFIKI